MTPIQKQKRINKTTSGKYWLTHKELTDISEHLHGEAKLIFQIMVATGQSFANIKETKWGYINPLLSTLNINAVHYSIPLATSKALTTLREQAESETSLIFKQVYRSVWNQASKVYFKLGIDQSHGVLKLPKWTFARLHFKTYRNKAKTAKAMGLTTTRYIPKPVFQNIGPEPCPIQF